MEGGLLQHIFERLAERAAHTRADQPPDHGPARASHSPQGDPGQRARRPPP
jgi:hypothetical protein